MTSVTHTTALRMPLFCSYRVFTILRDLLRNKRMESIWERGNAYADKSYFINFIITQNTFHINGQTFEIAKIFSKQLCLDLMP